MENILYIDSFVDENKKFALEYSGMEDDILVVETDNYIVFLTLVDNTLITDGDARYKKYEEFPDALKQSIQKEGVKDSYGKFNVLEKCSFAYCINKKLSSEEEMFMLCGEGFDEIAGAEEEAEKMMGFLRKSIRAVEEQ